MAGEDTRGDPEAAADLQAPLLSRLSSHELRVSESEPIKPNFWNATSNLIKVILGAGIMALPKAVALLGVGAGLSLMVLVALLTWFTVHGMVYASDRTRSATYSHVVRVALGPLPEMVLQAVMLLGCLGFEVVYIDIIGDLLVGSEGDTGILTSLLPEHLRHSWLVDRPVVLAALTAGVLAPLCCLRQVGSLGAVNAVGLASLAAFAGATLWLAAAAVARGSAFTPPLGPDVAALGGDTLSRVTGALAVVPILLTATSCHQSIHPLRSMLVPYSPALLDRVVAVSLAAVTALFAAVTLAAYVAFGPDVRGNFLTNLTPEGMAPLLGPAVALPLALAVRLGYAVSLAASTVLVMFPLRQAAMELVSPAAAHGSSPPPAPLFLGTTFVLLGLAYLVAVFVPSIWDVISFVGAVACTVMCFILPGALLIKFKTQRTTSHALQRAAAWAVVVLGAFLFANNFLAIALAGSGAGGQQPSPEPEPEPGEGAIAAGVTGVAGGSALGGLRQWLGWRAGRGPGADGSLAELAAWAGWGA